MTIALDENYLPSNGFAAKQFGVMEVEVNSQLIASSKNTCEYFLADFITKYANFNRDYITTGFQMEGYYDHQIYNYLENADDKAYVAKLRRPQCLYDPASKKYIYELIFFPSNGFCLDNKPLPLNTSLKLKFNRLNAGFSTYFLSPDGEKVNTGVHYNKPLEIKDCYALCEYVSSPSMRNYFTRIRSKPITYKYDEVTVSTRTIPSGTESITLHNIKGGNTPAYFFFALTPTDAFQGQGDLETTSFGFHQDLTSINLTLNGQSCMGYPQRITNEMPIWPYYKLMEILDRLVNTKCPSSIGLDTYKTCAIFGHEFMGTEESQGWLNLSLDFKNSTTKNQTLVMWSVHRVKVGIDEHGNVEKEIL
ncbi:Oidioi.mRNA.OKI2018_I69.chr1.g793.t1.cds [Oikopleura dioica]|uniref:Oidioi.mRNA.OKI2018_I69.chr1.g793.t1.cds n=1 Tax=Oikopleura dioica TaxID=34765 RepID=A0ABN7SV69_OIKDI|nr:Oidioi.mRNA.OKI2018_I69.chr1.g793.t1.cds [Oikopleura dioica]